MPLLSARDLRIAFGGHPLIDGASLRIERGERIGLVGRNGEGKSTLLALLAGHLEPDAGSVAVESGARVALLPQSLPPDLDGSVAEVVAGGLEDAGVGGGSRAAHPGNAATPIGSDAGGTGPHTVEREISRMELDGDHPFSSLSGGQQRRALLARALAAEPDLLLLDEPTNHLDIEGIEWLEEFVHRWRGSLLFVTHDRTFLRGIAHRIVELDRGALTTWDCGYDTYVERKEALLEAEARRWADLDRKLSDEEAWVRRGVKARRTRNEGRVRALEALRRERAQRRARVGEVRMRPQEAERGGTRVIVARDVSFGYPADPSNAHPPAPTPVVRDFSTTITRGDKVGVIGPNGSGKTTLVRLLLGEITPDRGTVEHGTGLRVAYFDQHRAQLRAAETVAEAVGFGSDHVEIDGERRHVLAYLQDFLFTRDRARQPVRSLSGGERNRLLLARLFTEPANVLVLDEPTNDLDAETLELLEHRLVEFGGTVLVVSHDRAFLDHVCTCTLVLSGGGRVEEHVGGYSDWKRVDDRRESIEAPGRRSGGGRAGPGGSGSRSSSGTVDPGRRSDKLTYNDQRELEALPGRIETLEEELARTHDALSDPELYRSDPEAAGKAVRRARALEEEIERAFERWSQLAEPRG